MSPRSATVARGNGARIVLSALLLVLVAVVMLLLLRARPETEPFDPRSSDPLGARGLVVLLERQGASVEVVRSAPNPGSVARVLVLQDRLNESQRDDLFEFVAAGGVLIMADPHSAMLGDLAIAGSIEGQVPSFAGNDLVAHINVPLAGCDIPALAHLRGLFVADGVRFDVSGSRSCFANDSGAFVVAAEHGDGLIVQLGDNVLFTNSLLRYADNGPLATALLAPDGDARVQMLLGEQAAKTTADIGSGEKTLFGLLRPSFWMALTQLAIAFVVFAITRSVRPGRPVREPEQVPIAGSELVVATGTLMRRARHVQRAGWLLRGNLYRTLCRRFHLSPTTSIEQLDQIVAANTSVPDGAIRAVLEREVADDADLLELSNSLQAIRETVFEGANS